jgi:hypothetical protein
MVLPRSIVVAAFLCALVAVAVTAEQTGELSLSYWFFFGLLVV